MANRSVDRYERSSADFADAIEVRSVLVESTPGSAYGDDGRYRYDSRDHDSVVDEVEGDEPAGNGGDDHGHGSRLRRRVLLALAGTGLLGGPLLAAKKLLNSDTRATAPDTRDAGYRAADAGGFSNRDESYASTGKGAQAAEPLDVFPTASEAAAGTRVTVPTILTTDDPVRHLLRRVTFGPTPALIGEVHEQGIDAWLAEQMNPTAITDETADQARAAFPRVNMDVAGIQGSVERFSWDVMFEYGRATLARQIWSRRQLFEVMVDFWANHLNVPMPNGGSWDVGVSYHEDVIREHALGSFTDMLLAATQHPAMLRYLSNADSNKESVNENLGRELLELHTVGVASGYTEDDVRNSAYILTGRTVVREDGPGAEGTFLYDPELHWTGPVQVLDFQHPNATAEGGLEVGDAYLRYLASHPSTARTIAYKLAVRLVSDTPPDSLVERLATTYVDSGTAIAPVLDILFRSGEFWAAVGQKTRRPLEDTVATARAVHVLPGNDTVGGLESIYWRTQTMGHNPLAWRAPNGYPDVAPAWRSAGGRVATWNAHRGMAEGWFDGLTSAPPGDLVAGRAQGTVGEYVDSLCLQLCQQTFQPQHRDALIAFVGADASTPTSQSRMDDLVGHLVPLVLDSPYFALR